MKSVIRVLIVDDSALVRTILVSMLEGVEGIQVVGEAANGEEAVRLAGQLKPDVITMDIRMPKMDGLQATRQIMRLSPTPIVVVANSVYESDLNIAFNAVAAGALTVVEKPRGISASDYDAVREQLVTTVRLMSDVKVVTLWSGEPAAAEPRPAAAARGRVSAAAARRVEVIAIAASTGGPGVLHQILRELPADFALPVVVVQHITPGFGQGFAHWLGSVSPLPVDLAQPGQRVAPGRVLIAPDDQHMTIDRRGMVALDRSEPVSGRRPSATRLFQSVASSFGPAAVGIVLTGMGDDGADGLEQLHEAGGCVIAQNEASCVVYGMPKVAIERGLADVVLAPGDIASLIRGLGQQRALDKG